MYEKTILEISPGLVAKAREELRVLHDSRADSQRWGYVRPTPKSKDCPWAVQTETAGCYGAITYTTNRFAEYPVMFVVFQGSGPELDLPHLISFDKSLEARGKGYKRPWNQFEGTDRTLEWVSFLLSENSPWKGLHPFLIEPKADEINQSGWLFELPDIPRKLLYNFCMAQRFPWEQCEQFATWRLLCQHGLPPQKALFISCSFCLVKGEAKDISGPWEILYPWSFLEGCNLDAASRFISLEPKRPLDHDVTPNVFPLWRTTNNGLQRKYKKFAEQCIQAGGTPLDQVLAAIDEAIEEQRKVW